MTTSTNAHICYGVKFEDEFVFPWDETEDDIYGWWPTINGVDPVLKFTDGKGSFLPEYNRGDHPDVYAAYDELRTWRKANPLPVTLINYCSGNYPMYIMAVPHTVYIALRGDPTPITGLSLTPPPHSWDEQIAQFCKRFDIHIPELPRWWLSSEWL